MKKWIGRMAVLLAFVLTLSGSTLAAFGKIPSATKEFYVNDYAGVFSDTWKEELCKAGEQLYEDTTAQLVVLTVDTTDGEDISDYAVETGRKWGIGSKKKNNGVLIVLSVSDRKVWVSVGYGLEGKLPDSKIGRLLDEYAVPSYKDNQFEKGTVELYYALLNEIREEYGLEKITAPRCLGDRAGACDDRFAHGGRISAVRDAACISYRDYGSDSEGPDNEIVGKGYRRLLEKEFQPYECTAPAL